MLGNLKNGLTKAVAGGAVCVVLATTASSVALTQENIANKLAMIHLKEVLLNRIVKSVCFIDAGVEADRNRQVVYEARDEFERSLADIKREVANLDQSLPAVRSLNRQLDKKTDQWFRMRVYLDRELKEHSPSESVLGQIVLMENGIEKVIGRSFKVLKKEAASEGKITLGDMIQEERTFERVMLAEKMVKEACLVAMEEGGAMERAYLSEVVMHFENNLTIEETSPLSPKLVKEMVPQWRAVLPRVRSLAEGQGADDTLLRDLDALKHEWFEVSGVDLIPSLG
ncbi:MAG: hypothetical protein AAF371_16820 [Pseudomonadota bacterium]